MTTKERILHEALRLFSEKGYEAAGVEEIASAAGIRAASMYKHFRNKRAIYDAILEEAAERYRAFTDEISIHTADSDRDLTMFADITADGLVSKVKRLVYCSLRDEYLRGSRKMLTIEQFRSPETAALYTNRCVNVMYEYHRQLFARLIAAGAMKDEDPAQLAMMYVAPVYMQISCCDRHPEREEECMTALENHIRLFFRAFSLTPQENKETSKPRSCAARFPQETHNGVYNNEEQHA